MPVSIQNMQITRALFADMPAAAANIHFTGAAMSFAYIAPVHPSAMEVLQDVRISPEDHEKLVNLKHLTSMEQIRNIGLSASMTTAICDNLTLKKVKVHNEKSGETLEVNVIAAKGIRFQSGRTIKIISRARAAVKGQGVMAQTTEIIAPLPPAEIRHLHTELKGRPASYHVGIGRAYVPSRPDVSHFPTLTGLTDEQVAAEVKTAQEAFAEVARRVRANLAKQADQNSPMALRMKDVLMILEQEAPNVIGYIEENKVNFKGAMDAVFQKNIHMFESMLKNEKKVQNDKMATLVSDLKIVYQNLILAAHNQLPDLMAGVESAFKQHNGDKVVLACHMVDFIEAASLDAERVGGVIEEKGGIMSHTTIACKALGIALVIGVDGATQKIKSGDIVIVDGEHGKVIVNPSKEVLEKYKARKKELEEEMVKLHRKYHNRKAITLDNKEVVVSGNSKSIAESARLTHEGVTGGVGLLRTEEQPVDIALTDGTIAKRTQAPSVDEMVEYFNLLFGTMVGEEIVIRTPDFSGDKYVGYLEAPKKDLLGKTKEGIGLSIDGVEHKAYYNLFRDVVKAILISAKAANRMPIIEFPMVMTVAQFKEAKAVVAKIMKELKQDKIPFESRVKFYAMVEHPNVMREIDGLAAESDGASFGSNDMTSKTLFESRYAATTDFNPLHPTVLGYLGDTVQAMNKAGKPFLVCGDMASDPVAIPVLLGLGVRHLSVDASTVNIAKAMISNIDIEACERLVEELKEIKSPAEIRRHVIKFIWTRMYHGDHKNSKAWAGLHELEAILMKYFEGVIDPEQLRPRTP